MKPKLKTLREALKMTQGQIAKEIGVSQPHYRRWETGALPIPENHLGTLAKILKTTPDAITGPKLALVEPTKVKHDERPDEEDDDDYYWGEVSIHFKGGGTPLLLSISEGEHTELFGQLQGDNHFHTVRTLANQLVVLNLRAISDVWHSHDDADEVGPDGVTYEEHFGPFSLTTSDWSIAAAINAEDDGGGDWTDKFDPMDVERVRKEMVEIEKRYEAPAKASDKQSSDYDKASVCQSVTQYMTYQLSNGQRRRHHLFGWDKLYYPLNSVVEFGDEDFDEINGANSMLIFQLPEAARSIFINPRAMDYLIVPTHLYAASEDTAIEDE